MVRQTNRLYVLRMIVKLAYCIFDVVDVVIKEEGGNHPALWDPAGHGMV